MQSNKGKECREHTEISTYPTKENMSTKLGSPKNIRTKILEEMRSGIFSDCKRLPRETELSEQFGISRTQMRDILSGLEQEGFVTRRHGVGTVINHHVLQVKNRMDIETEFMDIIRQNGYEASISLLEVEEDEADALIAEKLKIQENTPVIRIRLRCDADGKPAIYCEDVLEKSLVKRDYKEEDFQVIVFQFLERFCDVEAYMDLTEIHPITADNKLAQILKISEGTPLLNMEELDYDIEGTPIFYSSQYFVDGYFKHTVLRKKF